MPDLERDIDAAKSELARQAARLWPHRWHESNWFRNLLCLCGLHGWSQLNLGRLLPRNEVRFCRWCEKVKVDGSIYN